jgi:tRNA A37 threonylcarbamoyladenosine synthetase subunit TsaC/SUA5/YrdC
VRRSPATSRSTDSLTAPAATAEQAEEQLGESVSIYLDSGATGAAVPSTIVDVTEAVPRLLRAGAVSESVLREVAGDLRTD